MKKIEMAEMYIDDDIKNVILKVLENGRYIKGQQNEIFEKEFAKFCNTKYAVTVNSGTSALILALKTLNLKPNDEVIVPSHTFVATANSVIHAGAKPIFVDIDEETYNIDPNDIRKKINKNTKAILPVHLYGHPSDMDVIIEIADENNLYVVEDACQAHGALYKKINIGSIGDIAAFSFFPSKNMTVAGDGGAITTNNKEFAEKVAMLRDQGRKKSEKYTHDLVGYNFRLSEIHAAIGREQLKHIPKWIHRRRKNARIFTEFLEEIDELITPHEKNWAKHVFHLYVIRTKEREKLVKFLRNNKIPVGIHYPLPVHQQPIYMDSSIKLQTTEKIVKEIISLPVHPFMKYNQIEYIVNKINEFFKR